MKPFDELPGTPQPSGINPEPVTANGEANARIVTRLLNNFVLRFVSRVAGLVDGDFIAALILSEIVAANTAHLDRPETPRHRGQNDPPPNSERRPANVLSIANSLGIPYETTRRHVGKLMDQGLCVRLKGGVVVPTHILQDPRLLRKYRDDNADFRRLCETVRRLEAPEEAD